MGLNEIKKRLLCQKHQKGKPSVNSPSGIFVVERRKSAIWIINSTLSQFTTLETLTILSKKRKKSISFDRAKNSLLRKSVAVFLSLPLGENLETNIRSIHFHFLLPMARARRLVFHTRGLNCVTKYYREKRSERVSETPDLHCHSETINCRLTHQHRRMARLSAGRNNRGKHDKVICLCNIQVGSGIQ